jgi:hypothetical protein
VLLTTAGDQVPLIPFVEVVGSTGGVAPVQIEATGGNVGTTVTTLKPRHAGGATFPQRSVTDAARFVRQTWKLPLVLIAGLTVRVILLP